MSKIKVGIVFGGRSSEHEVSLVSANSIINAIDKDKYEVVPIGITKKGQWLSGDNVLESLKQGDTKKLSPTNLNLNPAEKALVISENQTCAMNKVEVMFPVLHGPYGEDGTIQGLFEMADLPYVGCGVLSSGLCMDKLLAKKVLSQANIPQAKYLGMQKHEWDKTPETYTQAIIEQLGFPCFVKPANLGSSIGISKVKRLEDLRSALELAFKFDQTIVIEEGINAREIECAILGNEEPTASVPGEIIVGGEFYDFADKYIAGKSSTQIPADLTAEQIKTVQDLAIKAFKALNGSGMARVDIFLDRDSGKFLLNELNTIPGFTAISMYPKLWEASGLAYPDLIDKLIGLAIERHDKKAQLQTEFASGSDWYKT